MVLRVYPVDLNLASASRSSPYDPFSVADLRGEVP